MRCHVVEDGGRSNTRTAAEHQQHATFLWRRNSTFPPGGGQTPCVGHESIWRPPSRSAVRGRDCSRSAGQGKEGFLDFRGRITEGLLYVLYSIFQIFYVPLGDALTPLIGYRTYEVHAVAGSSPDWTQPWSDLGQATYTCVPLSPNIWYRPRGRDALRLGM